MNDDSLDSWFPPTLQTMVTWFQQLSINVARHFTYDPIHSVNKVEYNDSKKDIFEKLVTNKEIQILQQESQPAPASQRTNETEKKKKKAKRKKMMMNLNLR